MRRGHLLKPNHVSDTPQQCIWFDTETRFESRPNDTLYHWLKFGYACYMRRHRDAIWSDEDWLRFESRGQFWDWVVSKTRKQIKLYLFCHNTSYDLPVMDVFRELPARGFELKTAIIDAPPTILRFRKGETCIMILDTLNLFRMPLSYLGQEIGLEKLAMPEDNDLGVTWDTYGKRDVEIIRDACIKWFRFLQENDYGSFAPTLAGQAMRTYRHKYMRHEIYIDDNEKALSLSRDGYYGARCECFRIGRFSGSFHLLDVNSMYPSIMARCQFPHKLLSTTRYATITDIQNWLSMYCVVSRVVVRTAIPFAPVRKDGKLVFPIGEFECTLSSPELQYALDRAEITKVIETAVYHRAYLFTEMMNDLYARRVMAKQAGRNVDAFLNRKIMNSFYGKWGQSGAKWLECGQTTDLRSKTWIEYDYEEKKITRFRQFGGLKQQKGADTESRDSFPAIAGHITAHARMELWRFISIAGVENVYYCDTDSVLVNDIGRERLRPEIDKEQMGKLSVKGQYKDVQIFGCKDYIFGGKGKTKGVRKDAKWLDANTVEQTKWSGLRGLVASGEVDKPITKKVQKHLSRLYDKGEILADGTCQPLWMSLGDL